MGCGRRVAIEAGRASAAPGLIVFVWRLGQSQVRGSPFAGLLVIMASTYCACRRIVCDYCDLAASQLFISLSITVGSSAR